MSAADYDALAQEYDARRTGARWRLYDAVTLASLEPLLPTSGGRALDAGAGTGRFSVEMLRRGLDVTLLDPSARMLDAARRNVAASGHGARAEFVQGTIERIDRPDGAFDVVVCEGDPLSYCLETHREAARELVRVLRPGGTLYVSVDARLIGALAFLAHGRPDLAFAAAEDGASRDPYGNPTRAFGVDELAALLADAGLRDVRVGGKVVLANFLRDDTLAALEADDAAWARLVDLERALAWDPHVRGMGGHLHATGVRA